MWPDVEETFIDILNTSLGLAARAGDTVPGDVENLPEGFIRVLRGPGSDDGVTDSPLVDIETFHPERGGASRLAERVRQVMLSAPNQAGVLIDSVSTASGPTFRFYGRHVARYVASYRVALRRPRNF